MLRILQSCIDRLFALVVPEHPAWSEDATRRARVVAGMCVGLIFVDLVVILPAAMVAHERPATLVPTLMAAGAFKMSSEFTNGGLEEENLALLLLGTAVSGLSAFLVVKWLIRFVQGHTFNGFAWYRVILGASLLVYAAAR